VRQLGAGAERIRILLNRASEPLLIAPRQIETALGYAIHHTFSSDYKTVSAALNSGVPLALTNHSELSLQFDQFTRGILGPVEPPSKIEPDRRRGFLGLKG
jgi:Flp pilus assembly CpaE family ATPase